MYEQNNVTDVFFLHLYRKIDRLKNMPLSGFLKFTKLRILKKKFTHYFLTSVLDRLMININYTSIQVIGTLE